MGRQGESEGRDLGQVHSGDFSTSSERHDYVMQRIGEKLADYDEYDFSVPQIRAFNIFFDLAQELRGRDMFYAVCMMIPKALFGLESNIYILEDEETFALGGCSSAECTLERTRTWDDEMTDHVVQSGESIFIPIYCNPQYADLLPFEPPQNIIGIF